jgi:hypothetical protein
MSNKDKVGGSRRMRQPGKDQVWPVLPLIRTASTDEAVETLGSVGSGEHALIGLALPKDVSPHNGRRPDETSLLDHIQVGTDSQPVGP